MTSRARKGLFSDTESRGGIESLTDFMAKLTLAVPQSMPRELHPKGFRSVQRFTGPFADSLCLLCATHGQKNDAIYGQRVSEEWCGQKKDCFYGHLRERQIILTIMENMLKNGKAIREEYRDIFIDRVKPAGNRVK